MDCARFFAAAADALGDAAAQPTTTTVGGQCVYEFFHPRVVVALGADGLATQFNRSGVVWAPPARRLGVQLRVPAAHGDAVASALAEAPLSVERTDHRGVSGPDGQPVTVLHFGVRETDVDEADLVRTLAAVGQAADV